jgi:hypothetical protein
VNLGPLPVLAIIGALAGGVFWLVQRRLAGVPVKA